MGWRFGEYHENAVLLRRMRCWDAMMTKTQILTMEQGHEIFGLLDCLWGLLVALSECTPELGVCGR